MTSSLRLFLALLFVASLARAANRYWCAADDGFCGVGRNLNWNCSASGRTNWGTASGTCDDASIPTSADDVFFDGVGGGANDSTISANISIRSLDMTGYSYTLTHSASVTLTVSTGFKFSPTMTYSKGNAASSALSFVGSSSGNVIDFAGKAPGDVTWNGGGSWQLAGTVGSNTLATWTLINGGLDTNGYSVDIRAFRSMSDLSRSLSLGSSAITVRDWDVDPRALTFNSGTSKITVILGSATSLDLGGLAYYDVEVLLNHNYAVDLLETNSFRTLRVAKDSNSGNKAENVLQIGGDQTAQNFDFKGLSADERLWVRSTALGTHRTLTATNSVLAQNVTFRDITAVGPWNLSSIPGRSEDCGGNSGIAFSPPITRYWIGAAGTHHWTQTARWSASSGGATGADWPLCQDTAIFDANSFTGPGQGVALTASFQVTFARLPAQTIFQNVTNNPTFAPSTAYSIYGSLTLDSNMNYTASSTTLIGRQYGENNIVNWRGKVSNAGYTVFAPNSTYTQQGDFSASSFTFQAGTYRLAGTLFLSNYFSSPSGLSRTLDFGDGTIDITTGGIDPTWSAVGLSIIPGNGLIKLKQTLNSSRTFAGGSLVYPAIWVTGSGTGTVDFTGSNTFASFLADGGRHLRFTAGTTTTITGAFYGQGITIGSITAGTHTLSSPTGQVQKCKNCTISRSNVTGGAVWRACRSTDGGNNAGWTFSACNVGGRSRRSWGAIWEWDALPFFADLGYSVGREGVDRVDW